MHMLDDTRNKGSTQITEIDTMLDDDDDNAMLIEVADMVNKQYMYNHFPVNTIVINVNDPTLTYAMDGLQNRDIVDKWIK